MYEFKKVIDISPNIKLARDEEDQFLRILRKDQNYENANTKTYGDKQTYDGTEASLEKLKSQIELFKTNSQERYKPKSDRDKTNICDAPGFGSVRLVMPYEDPSFDFEYFEFISSLIDKEDTVIDFGGGIGHFLIMLPECKKKILVEKNGVGDIVKEFGIQYQDMNNNDLIGNVSFCIHTLEHSSNPESLLKMLSQSDISLVITPREELIDTSINHYIYMQEEIFKKQFEKLGTIAYMRTSKNHPLDIHIIMINPKAINKFNKIKDNEFFKKNFTLYTNWY